MENLVGPFLVHKILGPIPPPPPPSHTSLAVTAPPTALRRMPPPVFMQLRDTKNSIEEDTRKYCLICGQGADLFDRVVEGGFAQHVNQAHNLWHYLYFMVYLNQKSEDEYTGTSAMLPCPQDRRGVQTWHTWPSGAPQQSTTKFMGP